RSMPLTLTLPLLVSVLFFSSRRRHTRFSRDWSSDVCSSDLPADVLEAAELDGAGGWQRFRMVTVPIIRPVLLIVGLLQIIWNLKVFTQIFVLQDAGGITRETNLIGTYIYRLGIGEGRFGLAAAASWFILLGTVGLSLYYVRVLLKEEAAS